MMLALVGVLCCVGGRFALTRFDDGIGLFEIKPTDLTTFFAVPVSLIVVALLACYLPRGARHRVDPFGALRYE